MSIFFPGRLLIVGQRSTGRFHVTIRSKFTRDNTALERRLVKFSAHWPNMTPEWFESRAWIWLHYAVSKLGRGELFEAIGILAFFREQVLGPMLYRRANLPQRGVRRIEVNRIDPGGLLTPTLATHYPAKIWWLPAYNPNNQSL